MDEIIYNPEISKRFRGFLPVVVDVETAGFNPETDALLEICACIIQQEDDGSLFKGSPINYHLLPFEGANLDPKALAFNGIDPYHPFRDALPEREGLRAFFTPIRHAVKASGCKRAILVGHNAAFDLSFINAAAVRTKYKRNPFHPFSTFDTVSLSALMYGQTVLARSAIAAGLDWDPDEAHSAVYDTEKTADLFCTICNHWNNISPLKPWITEEPETAEVSNQA